MPWNVDDNAKNHKKNKNKEDARNGMNPRHMTDKLTVALQYLSHTQPNSFKVTTV